MTRTSWTPNKYPPTRRSDRVDIYQSESRGQVRVPDPYVWLEEHTDETDQWTTDQQAFTMSYLDQNADRHKLEDEIRKNTDYEKFTAPTLKDDARYYWYYNSGLQSQLVIYRSKDKSLPDFSKVQGAGGEVFFDPNLLTADGTASLVTTAFSKSGDLFAYGISRSGSDVYTVYVRPTSAPFAEVDGKRPNHNDPNDDGRLPDEIRFVKFSGITWTHDSKGFFYQRYPAGEYHGASKDDKAGTETQDDKNAMLYYHRIGTPQSEDILVLKSDDNPSWMWSVDISETDGKYMSVYITRDTARKNLLWIADLEQNEIGPNMKFTKLVDEFEAEYDIITNDSTKLYIRTNKDAPLYKVVTVDLADPKREYKEFIPEDKSARLEDIRAVASDNFALIYKRDVMDEIYVRSMADSAPMTRLAPEHVGTAYLTGRRSHQCVMITMVGFTEAGVVAKYDFNEKDEAKRYSILKKTIVGGLVADDFISEQVWYTSKDGTKVPMFIVRLKTTKLDGTAPAIQYGYGGFSISVNPFFSPAILTFLRDYNAVLAVPNIRGGGEFGEEWHLAGTREHKVNVFDDFIAATEYLVQNKYAAPGKVAINGGSNGGLLVAACINRAPEGTFGAAVAEVGVLDLLKFPHFTIGKAWTSDYGDPKDPHDFDFIHPISPLHNVPTNKTLPPTILLTADHDDRVVPLHSFKHAATLQYTLPHNPHPLLVRIEKKAGHGAGKSTEQRIKEAADKWGFVAQSLGLTWRGTGW
ncbi:hypothetical protein NEOLEDRAFT_1194599 [Neolentinus lepideus HHB14362 ss-1]|uniref:Prolyl endopeptidase n=1 Tax=Neolentinus lepideus HHB14362 ss-1 TaxID=1314782 RepID=A0A165TRH7_9AGAM|nr:hypothetical protein NEOLEDRAFT_1194599 [Neolentinus lepideus HHB14362 ss-1]